MGISINPNSTKDMASDLLQKEERSRQYPGGCKYGYRDNGRFSFPLLGKGRVVNTPGREHKSFIRLDKAIVLKADY